MERMVAKRMCGVALRGGLGAVRSGAVPLVLVLGTRFSGLNKTGQYKTLRVKMGGLGEMGNGFGI
jgi:hypothetical protein